MTVPAARPLLLRRQCTFFSIALCPFFKLEFESPSVLQDTKLCRSHPCPLNPPSPCHTPKRWLHGVQTLRLHSASQASNSTEGFPSLGRNFPFPSRNYECAKFSTSANTSEVDRVVDDAAKRGSERCWLCEQGTLTPSGLFCSSCKSIQPVNNSVDFFQIFSIAQSFKVDVKSLEQNYKDLQKKLHPDLAGLKSQREQGYSADQSSHVIQAYYTLLRPLARARYLLELRGIKVNEESTIDDPKLLMEIMEVREEIEEASDAEDLKRLQVENDKRIRESEKMLEGAFRDEDVTTAVSIVQRLAYYVKISEEITRKL